MDYWAKYTNLDKSVLCKSREGKTAEANSEESKHYWKLVSDYRLILRQQRVRPVAADFFDDYPKPVDRENDHTISTTAEPCRQLPDRDRPMVHVGQVLANEEQNNRGKSEKPQAFPSQLSIFGGTPCCAEEETAFSSAQLRHLGWVAVSARLLALSLLSMRMALSVTDSLVNNNNNDDNDRAGVRSQTVNEDSESAFY